MKPILEVSNLSKKFRIHHEHQAYLSLRDRLVSVFQNTSKRDNEDFWALKDVSFNVEAGEAIGIIGKNGAGKSTLLKILSRITPPTEGKILLRGRIASLLEVGTGFHSELSGRENIFLNGSILGMKHKEIQSKFDEIVDFSGVEKFIDTPLKHYSSGMQLRLAFAVAAFLEPEILVIDEVLAVGDAEFQKKCLGKMEEVTKKQGRTLLFVSHNMGAISSMTSKAILLSNGKISCTGNSKAVIDAYLDKELTTNGEITVQQNPKLPVSIGRISILNNSGEVTNALPLHQEYRIKINVTVHEPVKHFIIGIAFRNMEDFPIRTVWSNPADLEKGNYEFVFVEKQVHLVVGKYNLAFALYLRQQIIQQLLDAIVLEFEEELNKEIALYTNSGIILNQMPVEINKLS